MSPIPINNHPEGAVTMKAPKPPIIAHQDQMGQSIETGDYIAFSYAYSTGIRIGRVIRSTQRRVRIAYKHQYTCREGEVRISEWQYLARPERTLVLGDSLDQQIVMLKLKNLVP